MTNIGAINITLVYDNICYYILGALYGDIAPLI